MGKLASPSRLFAALVLAIALCGCATNPAAQQPPAAPQCCTSNQIAMANYLNVLADALDASITTAIAARDAGKVSQEDLTAIENLCAIVARSGKQINAELRSPDSWPTQKMKIVILISNAGVTVLKGKISPSAAVVVALVVATFNEVSAAVGGPVV